MAGTLPNLPLSQQFDINGAPLAGCLLYFFAVGTVATPQNAYSDFGLTQALPNPIVADQTGRLPMFYLADGQVHVRLTDSTGIVIFDELSLQVIGPSSGGGGGGGGTVPASAIFATGDVKYRATSETLTGWIKLNGLTIGSASSGATQRANADTQNLFVYLWTNFTNTQCPVSTGRGSTALADFQANKTIGVPDWRALTLVGLDDMGNTAKGILSTQNFPGSSDTPTTPCGYGGEANHTLITNELAAHDHGVTDPGHLHGVNDLFDQGSNGWNVGSNSGCYGNNFSGTTDSHTTGITINNTGGGASHNNCQNFVLGTWYMSL